MDVKTELIQGLQSSPKYLPIWYRYDKEGSIYNDRCSVESPLYYYHRSETSCISENVTEMVEQMHDSCMLVDLGSGNADKARMYIDVFLTKQTTLSYVPVDVSAEYLLETCEALSKDYGESLDVKPIAGDFSVGIEHLKQIPGSKLILWLSGIQMLPYAVQVELLRALSNVMTENDRLIVSMDITEDEEQIKNAYNGALDNHYHLYINGLRRLNKDYDSAIDIEQFDLETSVRMSKADDVPSNVLQRAKAKCDLTYPIPGLGIALELKSGEYINLYEGEGSSAKYAKNQIQTLVRKGNQKLKKIWMAKDGHSSCCCLSK